ncbi:PLP-dependent aminotransferase family protein [Streptomyces sp. NBC_00236]|uniref:MocR-like transcription factor YczR n=1 Tax=unclassified Streptomyces TaxID=2593676 RepID=UPI002E299E8A|nr:PLP-dependent aminotransferase family protein [Streptomyces sp. NBC_00236]
MRDVVQTVRGRQLASLLPNLDGLRPLYRHLAEAISRLILDGQVALHVRLPAERELATALGVSRPTVTATYDRLRATGYAHSRQGSGTWTALPKDAAPTRVLQTIPAPDTTIDLARAAPALPREVLEDALSRVAGQLAHEDRMTGYNPYGQPQLRVTIAERFTQRGLPTRPEQILVTSGAQHALSLVLGLLTAPGDRILVENPSYPIALEAMRRAHLRTLTVPVSDQGWNMDAVESAFRHAVPQLAFLIPDFHNPTGLLMPDDERVRVLAAARRADSWLIVDETLTDLALDVSPPAPFASFAAPGDTGKVIVLGSMSKSHWGGLRIGWLRATANLVTELAGQRIANDLGGSVIDQLVADTLLHAAPDWLPAHLARIRGQRAALSEALTKHFPHWQWNQPPGGLSLWADLGEPAAAWLAERSLGFGVRIEGGGCFAAAPGIFENRLRIPYAMPPDVLRDAVQRMAAASGLPPAASTHQPHWIV